MRLSLFQICRSIYITLQKITKKKKYSTKPDSTKKIVVVNSSKIALCLIQSLLEDNGFAVQPFDNPISALRYIHVNKSQIIITDYKLPEMNGAELIAIAMQYVPDLYGVITTDNSNSICEDAGKLIIVEKTPGFTAKITDLVFARFEK